ncbi:hypothetical protein C8035_v011679 [Colletotrichum spinosum]|uniref:Uncharacterized protein n=1 Tax=Colletotrichum spinosum TaxID=1347390 RepID=A0A4R8Q3I8_9PEZI|nr:hypothetical protein C8035_v011679 [Colletotrichum spinosum]
MAADNREFRSSGIPLLAYNRTYSDDQDIDSGHEPLTPTPSATPSLLSRPSAYSPLNANSYITPAEPLISPSPISSPPHAYHDSPTFYSQNQCPKLVSSSPSLRPSPAKAPKDEEPLLEPRFLQGLLSFTWFVHFAAVSFTAGVVQLTFRQFYWFDEDNWNSQWVGKLGFSQDVAMNGLQFVAKVHEIIIVASVSGMVMHFCRRMLVGGGIPFGFLTGAYQVSSPDWLFSKNYLWASMPRFRSKGENKSTPSRQRALLGFGAAAICIYCNTVGPSSAIVMIPELEWWRVSDPYNGTLNVSYVTETFDRNYPKILNQSIINVNCSMDNSSDFVLALCPGAGHDDLAIWAESVAMGGPAHTMQVMQRRTSIRRELTSTTTLLDLEGSALRADNILSVATVPHASMAKLAGAFWNFVSNSEKTGVEDINRPRIFQREDVYSPLVQVQCKVFRYNTSMTHRADMMPVFGAKALRNFTAMAKGEPDAYNDESWVLPGEYWDYQRSEADLRRTNFTWVPVASHFPKHRPSLGAVVNLPQGIARRLVGGGNVTFQDSLIIPCMMDIRWVGVRLSFDPKSNNFLEHDISDLTKTLGAYWKPGHRLSRPEKRLLASRNLSDSNIQVKTSWASLLDKPPGLTVKNHTSNIETLFEKFIETGTHRNFQPPIFEDAEDLTDLLTHTGTITAGVLSHVVADGISRVSYRSDVGLNLRDVGNGAMSWLDLTNIAGLSRVDAKEVPSNFADAMTPYHWELERYGYGYGFVSRTAIFGVTILLLHAAVVFAYAIYIVIFRFSENGWSSKAWGSLDSILLLAMNSKPSSVGMHAGMGIKSNELFRETARVREGAESNVELILGDCVNRELRIVHGKPYHGS